MYVVKNEGSWVLFTKSNYLLNRALLNRGLGVFKIINKTLFEFGVQKLIWYKLSWSKGWYCSYDKKKTFYLVRMGPFS